MHLKRTPTPTPTQHTPHTHNYKRIVRSNSFVYSHEIALHMVYLLTSSNKEYSSYYVFYKMNEYIQVPKWLTYDDSTVAMSFQYKWIWNKKKFSEIFAISPYLKNAGAIHFFLSLFSPRFHQIQLNATFGQELQNCVCHLSSTHCRPFAHIHNAPRLEFNMPVFMPWLSLGKMGVFAIAMTHDGAWLQCTMGYALKFYPQYLASVRMPETTYTYTLMTTEVNLEGIVLTNP